MPAIGNQFLPQSTMQEQNFALRQQLYTSVYTLVYSPCGKYLAAGNNYGYCAIFSLPGFLSSDATENSWRPIFTFKVSDKGPVYSMTSTNRELICGCSGYIKAWLWSNIIKRTNKLAWSLIIPTKSFSVSEINSVVTDDRYDNKHLFAGCGDNLIYIFDLENSSLKSILTGHTDYIHALSVCNTRREFVSASEDGSIRIWDPRSRNEAVHIVEPYKDEMCARPEFGKWLGCVTMDAGDDWLICGGGPQLSLWHMRSLSATITFETNTCQKHVLIHEDKVLSAGSEPNIFHWSFNGALKAQIPCTPTSVYKVDVNTNSESNKVLCVAGNSSQIDVCTNFGYKAFSLTFPACN